MICENSTLLSPTDVRRRPEPVSCFAAEISRDFYGVREIDGVDCVVEGFIYPSNDIEAQGVVLYTVPFPENSNTVEVPILFEGHVNVDHMPEEPSYEAWFKLPRITWYPDIFGGTPLPDAINQTSNITAAAEGSGLTPTVIYL